MIQNKICTKCKINKKITHFKKRNSKSGYRSECKECEKIYRISNKVLISQKRKANYQKKKIEKRTKEIGDILIRFINGPLISYLTGNISFGKMKEMINEEFNINLAYSDIYPSPIFNAQISYEEAHKLMLDDLGSV